MRMTFVDIALPCLILACAVAIAIGVLSPTKQIDTAGITTDAIRADKIGVGPEANPYEPGTARHMAWYRAYMESREKRWKAHGYVD